MIIIDGTFLVYKSYFSTEKSREKFKIENNVQFIKIARNNFLRKVTYLLKKFKEDEIVFFFDSGGTNFRHEVLPYYQKKRQKKPEIVNEIKEEIYYFLKTYGFNFQISENVEADDLIASYVKKNSDKSIVIYTGDKDLAALVSPKVEILLEKHKNLKRINSKNFCHYFEVPPKMMFDYKSFVGDTSDNIKGIKIAPKEIVHLLLEYHSLENFFENGKEHFLYDKLSEKKEFLLKNKQVLKLKTDCPINIDNDKIHIKSVVLPRMIAQKIKWDF